MIHDPQEPPGDRMFLRGVELRGRHGVFDHERLHGQRFLIDLDWWLDASPRATTDSLGDTVCYAQVFETVRSVVSGPPVALIETLAETIAQALFDSFGRLQVVRVVVHKPEAPIDGVFSDVGVDITRRRSGRTLGL